MDRNIRWAALGLGVFSAALGAAELLAPGRVARFAGLPERPGLIRSYGLRELAAGLGLLTTGSAAFWLWARVVGDVLDLATAGASSGSAERRRRAARSLAAVAGVTALDVYAARAAAR